MVTSHSLLGVKRSFLCVLRILVELQLRLPEFQEASDICAEHEQRFAELILRVNWCKKALGGKSELGLGSNSDMLASQYFFEEIESKDFSIFDFFLESCFTFFDCLVEFFDLNQPTPTH